jgi:hypothetical protein
MKIIFAIRFFGGEKVLQLILYKNKELLSKRKCYDILALENIF